MSEPNELPKCPRCGIAAWVTYADGRRVQYHRIGVGAYCVPETSGGAVIARIPQVEDRDVNS